MVGGLNGNGFARLPSSNARRVAKVCGPGTKNPRLLRDRPTDGAASVCKNLCGILGCCAGLRRVGGLYWNGFARQPSSNARRVAKVCGLGTKNPQRLGGRSADGAASHASKWKAAPPNMEAGYGVPTRWLSKPV